MRAFEIYVNGEKVCTAGLADGVMSVIINHVGRRGFGLWIGGLDSEHVHWDAPAVGVGDEILVRLTDTEIVDPPTRRTPQEESDD
jgi:hypothetical protein